MSLLETTCQYEFLPRWCWTLDWCHSDEIHDGM